MTIARHWVVETVLPIIDARASDLSELPGEGSTSALFAVADSRLGRLILKIGRPELDEHRTLREATMLEHLAVVAPDLAPRTLLRLPPAPWAARIGGLALSHEPGVTGDRLDGEPDDRLDSVLETLAPLQADCWDALPRLEGVEEWGRGTAGSARPHRRRVRRFVSRKARFLERLEPLEQARRNWLSGLLDLVADRFEEDLVRLGRLAPTVLHGDLHPGNVLFGPDSPRIIDWQTASFGPAIHDLARFLGESLRGDLLDRRFDRLLNRQFERLERLGVDGCAIEAAGAERHAALRCVLAGLVSGYGNDRSATVSESRTVDRLARPDGLAGLVAGHLGHTPPS